MHFHFFFLLWFLSLSFAVALSRTIPTAEVLFHTKKKLNDKKNVWDRLPPFFVEVHYCINLTLMYFNKGGTVTMLAAKCDSVLPPLPDVTCLQGCFPSPGSVTSDLFIPVGDLRLCLVGSRWQAASTLLGHWGRGLAPGFWREASVRRPQDRVRCHRATHQHTYTHTYNHRWKVPVQTVQIQIKIFQPTSLVLYERHILYSTG